MAVGPRWSTGGVDVWWVGGGLYVEAHGDGLLLDAPIGAAAALAELGALPRLRSVMLTSGRPASVGGLVPLLCGLEPFRRTAAPLEMRSCLNERRGVVLASAWSEAWRSRYPVLHDGVMPGGGFEIGALEVQTVPVRHGEPRWAPRETVEEAVGVAVRVRLDDVLLAWVPGAAPGPAPRRACRGATLAVIEVAALAWPSSDAAWRLSVDDALQAVADADEAWIVGDDGRFGLPGHREAQ